MSLISVEHLIEPFKNKVHLTAICIAAALFGILRMQGGGVSVEGVNQPRTTLQQRQAVIPSRTVKKKAIPTRKKATRQPARSNQSGLDEIERTLGLR